MAKIQVWNENNCVAWLWSDDHTVTLDQNGARVTDPNNPAPLHICDMTSENSTLHEDVTDVPDDWDYDKYLYDGETWSLNPSWTAPEGE